MADRPSKAEVKESVAVAMKGGSYQPSKAEMEEEIDMPGWSLDQVRETFMRPFEARDS